MEATNQHLQSSSEPALILVTRESLIVGTSFMVDIKHLGAHHCLMIDAIIASFAPITCQCSTITRKTRQS